MLDVGRHRQLPPATPRVLLLGTPPASATREHVHLLGGRFWHRTFPPYSGQARLGGSLLRVDSVAVTWFTDTQTGGQVSPGARRASRAGAVGLPDGGKGVIRVGEPMEPTPNPPRASPPPHQRWVGASLVSSKSGRGLCHVGQGDRSSRTEGPGVVHLRWCICPMGERRVLRWMERCRSIRPAPPHRSFTASHLGSHVIDKPLRPTAVSPPRTLVHTS